MPLSQAGRGAARVKAQACPLGWGGPGSLAELLASPRIGAHSPAVFSAAWQRRPFVLHLADCGNPRCQDTARRGARPAAQTPRGLRGGTWPAFWSPVAGEESCGCSWRRTELQGRRRPGREPRAQGQSPRCLRVPSRASPAPRSARRRRGDTAGRGQGEERAERGLAPGRPGLAGPRLRQSAGADAGGGSGALGYQRAGRGAPGARRCGRCAPGRPAAPARSPLLPARPLALPFSPRSLQSGLSAAA